MWVALFSCQYFIFLSFSVLKRQQAQSEPIYEAATLQGAISGSGPGSLDHLPRTQRLRVCKKLRQEQLKRYYEQERTDHEKGEYFILRLQAVWEKDNLG